MKSRKQAEVFVPNGYGNALFPNLGGLLYPKAGTNPALAKRMDAKICDFAESQYPDNESL